MKDAIAFTKVHEDLLYSNCDAIKRNSEDIKRNSEDIKRNSEDIKRNSEEIAGLKKEVKSLAAATKENTAAISNLEKRTHYLGVMFEQHQSKLDTVLEVVLHMNKKLDRQDELMKTLGQHEYRISALESHIKTNAP